MSKTKKVVTPTTQKVDTVDAFGEIEGLTVRYSDVRAFMPCKDERGDRTGKTLICCSGFHTPLVVNLTYEQVKALVLPQ